MLQDVGSGAALKPASKSDRLKWWCLSRGRPRGRLSVTFPHWAKAVRLEPNPKLPWDRSCSVRVWTKLPHLRYQRDSSDALTCALIAGIALADVLHTNGSPAPLFRAPQERSQLDLLKQELETYAVPVNLKWSWKEESQGTLLERNWTEIVASSSVRAPV